MLVHGIGAAPSNGDIAVSLCLFVRFGMVNIFTFPLVSCLGWLGDIVVRAINGLMVYLTVHGARYLGAYGTSQFRRAELWLKDGGRRAHGKLPKCQDL